jgi:hypothetical protein
MKPVDWSDLGGKGGVHGSAGSVLVRRSGVAVVLFVVMTATGVVIVKLWGAENGSNIQLFGLLKINWFYARFPFHPHQYCHSIHALRAIRLPDRDGSVPIDVPRRTIYVPYHRHHQPPYTYSSAAYTMFFCLTILIAWWWKIHSIILAFSIPTLLSRSALSFFLLFVQRVCTTLFFLELNCYLSGECVRCYQGRTYFFRTYVRSLRNRAVKVEASRLPFWVIMYMYIICAVCALYTYTQNTGVIF